MSEMEPIVYAPVLKPGAALTLTELFSQMRQEFVISKSSTWRQKFMIYYFISKITIFLDVFTIFDFSLAAAMQDTVLETCAIIRVILQDMGTCCALIFMVLRLQQLKEALVTLERVAYQVAAEAGNFIPGFKEERSTKHMQYFRIFLAIQAYGTMVSVCFGVQPFITGKMFVPTYPELTTPFGIYLAHSILCYGVLADGITFFSLVGLFYVIPNALAIQYRRMGDMAASADTEEKMRTLVSLHAAMNTATRKLTTIIGPVVLAIVACALSAPVMIIFMITRGELDFIGAIMSIETMCVFVPMCMAGQVLEDASMDLGWAVYQGPWLTSSMKVRRLVIILMQQCQRPMDVPMSSIGHLNMPTCKKFLNSWFSWINYLVKFNN